MMAETPHVDIDSVLAIHRGQDGFIACTTKASGSWRDLFSIRAGELRQWIPEIRDHLLKDAYFSVNAFYRGAFWKSQVHPGLPGVYRSERGLRYLNACFTDLDIYNANISEGVAVGKVLDAIRHGTIPPVSIFGLSGRGLWCFWLLRDAQYPHLPQQAWPEKLNLWTRIQQAIAERLAYLAPDAKDAVRVTRIPGSVNSKSGRQVKYLIPTDENGDGFVYDLAGLAICFNVTPRVYSPTVKAVLDERTRAVKRKGYQALQRSRLWQFDTLRGLRGGFRHGCRNNAAMLFAHFLHKVHTGTVELEQQVSELGEECIPKLRASEVRAAIKSGLNRKGGFYDQTIANKLHITRAESALLDGWPAASWWSHRPSEHELSETSTRAERRAGRRKLMAAICRSLGYTPVIRSMQRLLDEQGHHASTQTIQSDYQAMKIGKRRPKQQPQSVFSFSASR